MIVDALQFQPEQLGAGAIARQHGSRSDADDSAALEIGPGGERIADFRADQHARHVAGERAAVDAVEQGQRAGAEQAIEQLGIRTGRPRAAFECGLVLGIGFLNREFTIYGAAALLLHEAIRGTLWTRDALRRWTIALATAAGVWLVVLGLRHYSSAAGPGTSTADLASALAATNLQQLAARVCTDPRAIASGAGQLFTAHLPQLFGLEPQPLTDFGIESTVRQGLPGAAWLLVVVPSLIVVAK